MSRWSFAFKQGEKTYRIAHTPKSHCDKPIKLLDGSLDFYGSDGRRIYSVPLIKETHLDPQGEANFAGNYFLNPAVPDELRLRRAGGASRDQIAFATDRFSRQQCFATGITPRRPPRGFDRAAAATKKATPMRALIALYFAIGIILLALGFLATGPCEKPNNDALNDTVFVLTWPVSLYGYVINRNMSPTQWLHTQACGGGLESPKLEVPHGETK